VSDSQVRGPFRSCGIAVEIRLQPGGYGVFALKGGAVGAESTHGGRVGAELI
jgi:hypothetical protein